MKLVILTVCGSAHRSTEFLSGFRHKNLGPKRNNCSLFLDGLLVKRKAEHNSGRSPIIPVPAEATRLAHTYAEQIHAPACSQHLVLHTHTHLLFSGPRRKYAVKDPPDRPAGDLSAPAERSSILSGWHPRGTRGDGTAARLRAAAAYLGLLPAVGRDAPVHQFSQERNPSSLVARRQEIGLSLQSLRPAADLHHPSRWRRSQGADRGQTLYRKL